MFKPNWKQFRINEPRYCSDCKLTVSPVGGRYIKYNCGKNQRWICENCSQSKQVVKE